MYIIVRQSVFPADVVLCPAKIISARGIRPALVIDIGMVVLSIVPKSMDWIAKKLGIHVGPFVLVLFMLGGMILILFQQSIALSRHNEKIKRLAEELTLLREKVAKNKHEE